MVEEQGVMHDGHDEVIMSLRDSKDEHYGASDSPPRVKPCRFMVASPCVAGDASGEHTSQARHVARHQHMMQGQNRDFAVAAFSRRDFIDDLTGLPLPPDLCRAARQKELDYFKSKGVWEIRSVNEARKRMGRAPISVRWVETNKGDDANPNIRSRLVAREIRTAGQDAIFAPTPPLESLRMVLSYASSDIEGVVRHCRDTTSEERT